MTSREDETAAPPMTPTAEERVMEYVHGPDLMTDMVERAYRDGFNASSAAAERATIVAWLRKKPLLASIHAAADEIERGEHDRNAAPDAAGKEPPPLR